VTWYVSGGRAFLRTQFQWAQKAARGTSTFVFPIETPAGGGPEFEADVIATIAVTATIAADHGVTGTIAATITPTATIAADHGVTGTIAGVVGVTGTIAANVGFAGTIAATITPTATIVGTHDITAAIAAVITPTATIAANAGFGSTITAVVDVTGTIAAQTGDVIATIDAVVPITTVISANVGAIGTIAAVITPTATISGAHGIVGTMAATITPVASIAAVHGETGTIAAVITPVAAIAANHGITGTIGAVVNVIANIAALGFIPVPIVSTLAATISVTASIIAERVFSQIHQRAKIRNAAAAALMNATAAGARVVKHRFLPWFPSKTPAIGVYTLDTETLPESYSTAPRKLEHRVLLMIQAAVEAGSGNTVTESNPSTPDDDIDDICAEIEAAIAADPTLAGTAGDSWLMGTEVDEYDTGDSRYAVATLTVWAFYERGYPAEDDLLLIDEFNTASVVYRANGAGDGDEAEDLLEGV